MTDEGLNQIIRMALILLLLYVGRVVFRFLNNYLAHKAAWELVGDLRQRLYEKMQVMDLGFFHDKQTGDLMSRVVNDTREFELLYAHIIPDIITNNTIAIINISFFFSFIAHLYYENYTIPPPPRCQVAIYLH